MAAAAPRQVRRACRAGLCRNACHLPRCAGCRGQQTCSDQARLLPAHCVAARHRFLEFAPLPLFSLQQPALHASLPHDSCLSLSSLAPALASRYLEFNLLYDRGVKFGLDGGRCAGVGLRQGAARCSCLVRVQAACHSMEMLLLTCCCSIPSLAFPKGGVNHGVCATADCLEVQRAARGRLSGGAAGAAASAAARVGVAQQSGAAGVARCRRNRLPLCGALCGLQRPALYTLPDSQATELFPAAQPCCFLCPLRCSALFPCRWLLPCSLRCSHLPAAFCNTHTHAVPPLATSRCVTGGLM